MLKWCVVVLMTFVRVVQLKADPYSLYNISDVPPLCGRCGLTQEQVEAAEQQSNWCCTNEKEVCSSFECIEKQEKLVDCLVYEETGNKQLEKQLGLDVQALQIQLYTRTDAKERAVSHLFDVINELNKGLGNFYELVRAYEATARQRATQRTVVTDRKVCFLKIRRELCRAKEKLNTYKRLDAMVAFKKNPFSLHVTGCQPCTDCPPDDGGRGDCCPIAQKQPLSTEMSKS